MQVDIWSDVVCPWCYIGKRRYEAALARFPFRDEVRTVWHSFELDPTSPRHLEGSLAAHLAAKYGTSLDSARAMQDAMTEAAAGEGLDYRFDVARSGNTFDAHRLLHLALERGVQDAVKERLFRAYYTEGEPIGDVETLVRVSAQAGLDAEEARRVLAGDDYAEAVRADERQAVAFGISGVPFFVLDGKYGVSGAQSADLLLEVLQRAWSESHPLTLVTAGAPPTGGTCEDGSCAI